MCNDLELRQSQDHLLLYNIRRKSMEEPQLLLPKTNKQTHENYESNAS